MSSSSSSGKACPSGSFSPAATFPYSQVNVFSADALSGNPLAVVHGAEALSEAQMAMLARWTNLSETTFLLPPTDPGADYRVRIFTPARELPFAGHPTLGSCESPYVASQGAALGRAGRVYLRRLGGEVWVGGDVVDVIRGEIAL